MLINVDQLWKPADQPPKETGTYLCYVTKQGCTDSIQTIFYRKIETGGYFYSRKEQDITHWMPLIPSPGFNTLMEIPSEATLQLYGSDSELACIKVETREGHSGAAIAVLIRTDLSTRLTGIANEDGPPSEPEGWVDDEVVVSMQAYDSQDDKAQWKNRSSLTFVDAKYNLEREAASE